MSIIYVSVNVRPKIHGDTYNEFGALTPVERLVGFDLGSSLLFLNTLILFTGKRL